MKTLQDEKVNLFITINQYNLKDLLIILACKRLNITTKELSHHLHSVWGVPDKGKRTLEEYVDEFCVWNSSEKRFIEKYVTITSVVNTCRVNVAGCPELSYYAAKENMQKYGRKDAIILFVPTYPVLLKREFLDEIVITDAERQYLRDRKRPIFDAIYALASKGGLDVYIRYHPIDLDIIIEDDFEIANMYNFSLLSKSREDLIKGLCGSKYSALAYGCECYNINVDDAKYDFCGLCISSIDIDDIASLTIGKNKNEVEFEGYMDLEKLFNNK